MLLDVQSTEHLCGCTKPNVPRCMCACTSAAACWVCWPPGWPYAPAGFSCASVRPGWAGMRSEPSDPCVLRAGLRSGIGVVLSCFDWSTPFATPVCGDSREARTHGSRSGVPPRVAACAAGLLASGPAMPDDQLTSYANSRHATGSEFKQRYVIAARKAACQRLPPGIKHSDLPQVQCIWCTPEYTAAPAIAPPSPFQARLASAHAAAVQMRCSRSSRSSSLSFTNAWSSRCGQSSRFSGVLCSRPCGRA